MNSLQLRTAFRRLFAQWYLLGLAARDAAVDDVVRHGAEPARGHDGEGAADEAGDPEIRLLEELELFSGIAPSGRAASVAFSRLCLHCQPLGNTVVPAFAGL